MSTGKALSVRGQQHNTPANLEGADIVIVGNGIAGLTAAIEARRHDKDKRIVVMTDQLHPTINTPSLKQFAIKKLNQEQLLAYPLGTERSMSIHVFKAHVEQIHAKSKYLGLDRNRAFGYGKLLIATGSKPVGLPEEIPGRTLDGVLTLHRFKDYLDLRRRLPEVREAVVVGGGVHANEIVMSLLHWHVRVHWLIRGKIFLPDVLDHTASEMVLDRARRAGAIVYTETEIASIVGHFGTVAGVITNRGKMLSCQLVVSCTGVRPAQELASQSTMPIMFDNGILVDGQLRTSVQDIYAAGDVAALPNPQTGTYETRAQWYSAVTQGKIAGAMMIGHSDMIKDLLGVQWHATHLSGLPMLTVGDPLVGNGNAQVAIYTDTSGKGYRRLAIVDDRLVGYLSIGSARPDALSIKRFVDEGLSIRSILNPLLQGKFDAHEYFTKARTCTLNQKVKQPLPLWSQVPDTQWTNTGSYWVQPPTRMLPAALQVSETGREKQLQQKSGKEVPYKSEQAVETGSAPYATLRQYMKPLCVACYNIGNVSIP